MKKLIASFILVMVTFMAIAQTPATFKFLGIPVDGKKSDVIAALKNKGFVYDAKNDVLKGRFNGIDSEIMISENYGKVDRIYVADEDECGEAQIIIRFNTLLQQFRNNEKYVEVGSNEPISRDENISYEMSVHNKTYDASFYLNPIYEWTDEDKMKVAEELSDELKSEIESGKYKDLTDEQIAELLQEKSLQRVKGMVYGHVWFRISDSYGKYFISLYYDNLRNRPNGEDL